uniref:Uncharacterized protein n=1 Tax=Meloidogyne incognita TaxID=6306 RepID=A0A914LJS6_MELIC
MENNQEEDKDGNKTGVVTRKHAKENNENGVLTKKHSEAFQIRCRKYFSDNECPSEWN